MRTVASIWKFALQITTVSAVLPKSEARNFIFMFCYDEEIEKINVIHALTIGLSRKI